jgi:hypothetical protein
MEDHRILSCRSWSLVRKGLVVGALAGLLLTVVPIGAVMVASGGNVFPIGAVFLTVLFPTDCIYMALSHKPLYSGAAYHVTWMYLLAATTVNTFLVTVLGALLGYLIRLLSSHRDPHGN